MSSFLRYRYILKMAFLFLSTGYLLSVHLMTNTANVSLTLYARRLHHTAGTGGQPSLIWAYGKDRKLSQPSDISDSVVILWPSLQNDKACSDQKHHRTTAG